VPDIPVLKDGFETISAAVTAIVTGGGVARWVVRKELPRRRQRRAEQVAINEVLLGRPAIPANTITGAPAQPAVPSIGQQVAAMRERVEDIHHEVHPNGGGSMRDDINVLRGDVDTIKKRQDDDYKRFAALASRLGQVENLLKGELHTANDAVANAAEAAAHLLPVVHDAIKAQPPES
jgi:hypothetical protein